jgi:holliday junction DNA helicase RuvB
MRDTMDGIELLSIQETLEERTHDFIPLSFDDYIGQRELKEKLRIYTQAANMRGEALDHLLLFGPPGLGKTTLSQIMATVMGVGIKICSGPTMERTGDLVAILSSLQPRDILFIDEIHRMPTNVEEVLYSAMEQFRVDVIIGQGAGAKSVNLPLHPFTLIGATTKTGMISAPLRSRFGISERLDFYEPEDLRDIILQTAAFLQCPLNAEGALRIALCARGTPRIAKKILRRVRDVAQVTHKNLLDVVLVEQALTFLGMDEDGLSKLDNILLRVLLEHFDGGPAGLETLAALIGEDKETLEQVYEPFLLRSGYLEKTGRGRQIPHKKLPYLRKKFFGQETVF